MGPLALLGFASLWAGLGLAEVVSDFSKCNQYFHNGAEPKGFDQQNRAKICQRYGNEYHFATFYDKSNRIPVWSAYNMKEDNSPAKEVTVWMVEPQLSGFDEKDMRTKTKKDGNLKTNQAVSEDYDNTSYDRGHLNPNSFQCDKGRKATATFTLTNAVPMNPRFNRVQWCNLEQNLKRLLKNKCIAMKGKPFLVTGAVPNPNHRIPIKDRRDNNRDTERVVVPSHIWTAVCCEHSNNNEKFSFAVMGVNKPDSILKAMEMKELNKELTKLYKESSIEIFNDDCNKDSRKSDDALKEIKEKLNSSFPQCNNKAGPSVPKKPRLSSVRKRRSLSGSGSSLEGGGREAA